MTENIQELMNYGVLGLFASLMIWVIWYLEKQRRTREIELLTRIAKMEQKMDDQQNRHDEFLRNEFVNANAINEKCLKLMDEVKSMLSAYNKKN